MPDGKYTEVAVSSGIRYADYANRNYRLHRESPVRGMAHDGQPTWAPTSMCWIGRPRRTSGAPDEFVGTSPSGEKGRLAPVVTNSLRLAKGG